MRAEAALVRCELAYSCAYTARCGHALGPDQRGAVETFAHFVSTQRESLLDL
jgi:hypothetical protein